MNPVNHIMVLADHFACSHPDHYAETRQALRAAIEQVLAKDAYDMLHLIKTIQYMTGIAERGEGRDCRDDEMPEQFLLNYVKRLEQELATQVPDKRKIAEALRRHGLTLVETSKGYAVLKLGEVTANIRDVQDGLDHAMLAAVSTVTRPAWWVGLTNEEIQEKLRRSSEAEYLEASFIEGAKWAEAVLKQKNEVKK